MFECKQCLKGDCGIHNAAYAKLCHEAAKVSDQPVGSSLVDEIMKDISGDAMNAGQFDSRTQVLGLNYIRATLLRHIKAPERESGDCWQPMDTAPKDKGPILVASATRHQVGGKSFPYCHVVTWDKYHESWETWSSNHYSDDELMGWQLPPVHPLSQIEGGKP